MTLHPIFKFRENTNEGVLRLLDETVLGTNGAKYRHADTAEKLKQCDRLVHLTMERNENVLGNISFCRRKENWYIRYFAFKSIFRSKGQQKTKASDGLLRRELEQFFQEVLNGEYGEDVDQFYAYIDPANQRSLWMSENFKFTTIGQIATQTFSRSFPKKKNVVKVDHVTNEIIELIEEVYKNDQFYTDVQWKKGPFYVLKDDTGAVVACTRYYSAHWEFQRLPGKFGGLLTKVIPYIPFLNRIIQPKDHRFLVPEAVVVKGNDPQILSDLFEGMLECENRNLILWWVDESLPLYASIKRKVSWGILHKITGVHNVNAVCRSQNEVHRKQNKPIYTVGLDFI